MKFKKFLAATAIVASVAVPSAHAGVIGSADLAITGLLLLSGGQPVTSGLSIVRESRTGNAGANFNNVDGVGAGSGSKSSFGTGATVDVSYRCAGPDCGALAGIYGNPENNSVTHLKTAAGNFALGDMYIAGSALGGGSGAEGLTRADASVSQSSNQGGANSTILNSALASTTFLATQDITANFAVSFSAFVNAIVEALSPGQSGLAAGTIGWSLSMSSADDLTFPTTIWSPAQLNQGFTSNDPSQNQTYEAAGTIFSNSFNLLKGHSYSLTIQQSSNATAQNIPEPGSLLLVGLGLFALTLVTRQRRA